MIDISNLTVTYSGEPVFEDITFRIGPRDRIGLAGRNGSGKSTLLKTLAGLISPDEGDIAVPKGHTTGYLPQETDLISGGTLYEEAQKAFDQELILKKKIADATEKLVQRSDFHSDEYMNLASRVSEWNESLSMLGGNKMDAAIEQVLKGLGFSKQDFDMPANTFSGGWQMRIYLARLLLKKPELLLLDEPTNHLDIDSLIWLESFLAGYEGAIVVVSHDSRFLDKLTTRTIELEFGSLYDYKAPYSEYRELRKERIANMEAARKNQERQVKQNEKFIERFRYKASKASQVQSRIKQLEKMDRINPDEEDQSKVKFRFPDAPRSGRLVAVTEGLSKSYGENQVLNNVDFALQKGDKAAFLGKNGEGKSTFARILADIEDYTGVKKPCHNVIASFYAQHRDEELNGELSVLETMEDGATAEQRPGLRNLLGAFLFKGDDVYKKVKVLSGGEKSRLSLAKMLLQPSNFLILDEPTNHLDMYSKEVLKNALQAYNGTLVIVSHDREFLDGLVNICFEFAQGKIQRFEGGINYYLQKKESENVTEKKQIASAKSNNQNKGASIDYEKRKQLKNKRKNLQNKIATLEKTIEELETEIRSLELEMQNPEKLNFSNGDTALFDRYEQKKDNLKKILNEWEQLNIKMERL